MTARPAQPPLHLAASPLGLIVCRIAAAEDRPQIILVLEPATLDHLLHRVENEMQAANESVPEGSLELDPAKSPLARARFEAVWGLIDDIGRRPSPADPVKARIHQAIDPWEAAYDFAFIIAQHAGDAIIASKPHSPQRRGAVRRIVRYIEKDLVKQCALAVRDALTDELARRLASACECTRSAALRVCEVAIATPRYGDRDWAQRCAELNDAILLVQELRPLQRRAADRATAESSFAIPSPGARKPATKEHIERLARQAVRRAHQGYIDDDVFIAAISTGLSYRKSAVALSLRYGRSVTKRQVEEAVKRCGGLKRIRQQSGDLLSRSDL